MDISGFSVDKNLRYLGIPGDSQCVTFIFIPDPGRSPMVTFWACFFFQPPPTKPPKKNTTKSAFLYKWRYYPVSDHQFPTDHQFTKNLQITRFNTWFVFCVFWWVINPSPKTFTISSSPPSHPIRWHWIRKRLSRGRNGGALRTQINPAEQKNKHLGMVKNAKICMYIYIIYIVITATGAGLLPHDNYSFFLTIFEIQFGHSGQELHMTAPLSLLNISWKIEFQGSRLNKNQILGHEEFTPIKFLVP